MWIKHQFLFNTSQKKKKLNPLSLLQVLTTIIKIAWIEKQMMSGNFCSLKYNI